MIKEPRMMRSAPKGDRALDAEDSRYRKRVERDNVVQCDVKQIPHSSAPLKAAAYELGMA